MKLRPDLVRDAIKDGERYNNQHQKRIDDEQGAITGSELREAKLIGKLTDQLKHAEAIVKTILHEATKLQHRKNCRIWKDGHSDSIDSQSCTCDVGKLFEVAGFPPPRAPSDAKEDEDGMLAAYIDAPTLTDIANQAIQSDIEKIEDLILRNIGRKISASPQYEEEAEEEAYDMKGCPVQEEDPESLQF